MFCSLHWQQKLSCCFIMQQWFIHETFSESGCTEIKGHLKCLLSKYNTVHLTVIGHCHRSSCPFRLNVCGLMLTWRTSKCGKHFWQVGLLQTFDMKVSISLLLVTLCHLKALKKICYSILQHNLKASLTHLQSADSLSVVQPDFLCVTDTSTS